MADTQTTQMLKSSFTPFMSESYDRQQLKRLIMLDIDEVDYNALNIPTHMRMLYSQCVALFNPYENQIMLNGIDSVTANVNAFLESRTGDDDSAYSFYRSRLIAGATDWLAEFAMLALKHGLSDSIEKDRASTPYDLLKSILDIPGYRTNSLGFPITYQQRIIAEFALERVSKGYDFIMLVVGKRGRGKSTFIDEVMSTFLELEGRPFGIDNIVFTETREQMFNMIKEWQPGDGNIFDEAVNQLFSRDFFKSSDFISLLTEIRYKRTFTAFLIPELYQIDKIVRDGLADIVVTITERGIAIMMAPSLAGSERYMTEKMTTPVLTPTAHTDFLLNKSLNSIVAIPFLEISEKNEFWVQYSAIKDGKVTARKFTKPRGFKQIRKKDEYYHQLVMMVANTMPNASNINAKTIETFSDRVNYKLTPEGLAGWLGNNLGLKKQDLLIATPDGRLVDVSNSLVQGYMKKSVQLQKPTT
jgi:hypothetical protein